MAVLSACRDVVETEDLTVPLRLIVPASETQLMPRRVVGDPGHAENLDLPRYAYVFMVFMMKNGRYEIKSIPETDLYEGGRSDADIWEKVDTAYTGGDVVYSCKINFALRTPVLGQVQWCHVYAAMSQQQLTLSSLLPQTEEDIKQITFSVTDDLQSSLQNIYSTPCNYLISGKYYGEVNIWSNNVPVVNLMLYHVASKVDMKWNVPETARQKLRVTRVKAKHFFKGESYLFQPTENIHSVFTESDGYTPSTDLAGDVAGTWWAGRTYFYTIPYRTQPAGGFPMQIDFDIKNTETDNNTYTESLRMTTTFADDVFVPWVRGQLMFNTPPTADNTRDINTDEL